MSILKETGTGASGGYLSCDRKKDTKEAGQRGSLDLPIETPWNYGVIAPGNQPFLIRCATHHPLESPRPFYFSTQNVLVFIFDN